MNDRSVARSLAVPTALAGRARAALAVIAAAAVLAAPALARSPAEFAWSATMRLTAEKPWHRVVVPLDAYQASTAAGLADLRVLDASGREVAFAFESPPESPRDAALTRVPALALRQAPDAGAQAPWPDIDLRRDGDRLRLTVRGAAPAPAPDDGVVRAYYVDREADRTPFRALVLHLRGDADFNASVGVEGSDDLRQWQSLAVAAPLLRVSQAGRAIVRDRIELPVASHRYLRIVWPASLRAVVLEDVSFEGVPAAVEPEPVRLRLAPETGASGAGASTVFEYDAGAPVPARAANLRLAEPNSIAPVRIEVRDRVDGPWRDLRSATFYRVEGTAADAAPIVAPDAPLPAGTNARWWRVSVDRRAGDFSRAPPELELAWPALRVVFAARGPAPYTLAVGHPGLERAALALEVMVPGLEPGKAPDASPALLDTPTVRTTRAGWWARLDRAQVAMWAALLVAVALLGALAWRLLRTAAPAAGGK